jgi:predicted nucleotidyltransferase
MEEMERDTSDLVRRLRAVLLPREEILEAYLYGSRARGGAHAASDVDVALYVDEERMPAATFGYEAEITTECMQTLGTNRVDVVRLNHASPLLYHRVLRDGVRLLSRDLPATTAREARAMSRYCHYVPQLAKIEMTASQRIRRGDFGR